MEGLAVWVALGSEECIQLLEKRHDFNEVHVLKDNLPALLRRAIGEALPCYGGGSWVLEGKQSAVGKCVTNNASKVPTGGPRPRIGSEFGLNLSSIGLEVAEEAGLQRHCVKVLGFGGRQGKRRRTRMNGVLMQR